MAAARARHRLGHIETARGGRSQQHVDPRGQRHIGLPRPQTLTRQMHRHQRRRTRRVHRHRRTTQIEEIRQPIGDDAHRATGSRPRIDRGQIRCRPGIRTRRGTPRRRPRSACRGSDCGGIPAWSRASLRHLQQQPLLGVHLVGLPRRDLEELRVEGGHIIEKATPPRGRWPGPRRPPESRPRTVPIGLRGTSRSRELARDQELPQRVRIPTLHRGSGTPPRSPRSARSPMRPGRRSGRSRRRLDARHR